MLKYPIVILAFIVLLVLLALYHAPKFSFDASSDTLVAENDPALSYYQEVRERFTQGGESFLFLTYTPKTGDPFTVKNLSILQKLQTQLNGLKGVSSVYSMLDAPLLQSPSIALSDLKDGYKTLASPEVDPQLAKKELTSSPIFKDLIISADGRTTLLRITLNLGEGIEAELEQLRKKRDKNRVAFKQGDIEKNVLIDSTKAHKTARQTYLLARDQLLTEVRQIRDQARTHGDVFLGGVPMVAADMISFVKQDIVVFSAIIFFVVIVMLSLFFRHWLWVVLPLATSTVTIILVIGWLGAIEKPVTIISSNFISLLAILTISFTVHLIVRYRELSSQLASELAPDQDKGQNQGKDIKDIKDIEDIEDIKDIKDSEIVFQTMRDKLAPSFYTGLTTTVAFASLIYTDIVPVQDFGLLMCVGVIVSLLMTYTLFPALLLLLEKPAGLQKDRVVGTSVNHDIDHAVSDGARIDSARIDSARIDSARIDSARINSTRIDSARINNTPAITSLLSTLVTRQASNVLLVSAFLIIITGFGISTLSLDNRFIDYFKTDTDIRQGMLDIDQRLGGTLPFDVIITFPPYEAEESLDEDDMFFSDEETYPERYWVTPNKLSTLRSLQDYIQSLEQTGKVMSLANLEQVAMEFIGGESLSALEIVGILGVMPEAVRTELVDPYLSPYSGEMLISVRVKESGEPFSRDDYLNKIKRYAVEELGLKADDIHTTGMLVLFNNMLTHLFDSQLQTFLYVVALIFLMLLILMRSFRYALIGLLPNTLAAMSVLAVMGYLHIPLDLMTITIAAIVIGIGIDNAIHYLHRFKLELEFTGNSCKAVTRSHASIGSAIYFTSLTIVAGFSILVFSNFVPTVYFGVFTSLAMILALLANLLILPSLLVLFYKTNT